LKNSDLDSSAMASINASVVVVDVKHPLDEYNSIMVCMIENQKGKSQY